MKHFKTYLAPYAPAKFAYTGTPYKAGDRPEEIEAEFTSAKPGFLHITLVNGCHLTVETGKGYLISELLKAGI
jgi:hypothetical protein